jgi:hypothetical protein
MHTRTHMGCAPVIVTGPCGGSWTAVYTVWYARSLRLRRLSGSFPMHSTKEMSLLGECTPVRDSILSRCCQPGLPASSFLYSRLASFGASDHPNCLCHAPLKTEDTCYLCQEIGFLHSCPRTVLCANCKLCVRATPT